MLADRTISGAGSGVWCAFDTHCTPPPRRGSLSDFASLSSQRFQVLFHSPFGGLFTFPSRYLCAIGLLRVFSLRRDLPPTLSCTPKQPDSASAHVQESRRRRCLHGAFTLPGGAFHNTLGHGPRAAHTVRALPAHNSRPRALAGAWSRDSHAGLFPLHSPLLGESWLFSLPPLTKMLQFSGCSCLI